MIPVTRGNDGSRNIKGLIMKKITTIILSVLLIASLFVSCDNATKAVQDELAEVTLSTQASSRSLTVSNPLEDLSDVNWFYKATKVSERQFNYGEKTTETPITLYPTAGQSKQTLTLSQGKWIFELFGKSTDGNNTLLYRGTTDEVLILRSAGVNQITVDVSPYTDAEGKISFKNVKLDRHDGEDISPNYLYVTGPNGYSKTYTTFNGTEDLTGLNAGQYTVTVAWKETMTGDNPYTEAAESSYDVVIASETIVVTVYGGRTTTIEGNISEETGSGTINGNIEIKTEATQQKTVVADTPTTFTVNVAPANSVTSNKVENTTVTFAKNVFTSDQTAILTVEVKDISSSIVDSSFTVENGKSAVAGISLTLTVGETTQTGNFGNAVIETYIAKGLTSVQVKYNGTGTEPEAITNTTSSESSSLSPNYYESDTGKLVFSTTHFSEYYVVADEVVALNTTTNTAYKSLRDAFAAVQNNENLVILNNCETGSVFTITNPLRFTASNVTLDLNDKTITVNNNFSFLISGDNSVVKNGNIVSATNESKLTKINSYVLVVNNCENVVLEGLTLIGGLSLGGDQTGTPNYGAATNAVVRNCNITSGDYYAVCSQMNSTAKIESGTYNVGTKADGTTVQTTGALQAYFVGNDGPAGNIEVTGGTFTGTIKGNNKDYLVIKGGTFSTDPSDYVPFGYNVDLDGDKYVVSEASSLEIKSADDLMKFAAAVNSGNNYLGETIILRNNVDLTGKTWVPIGQKNGNKFSGIFDGNSKEISGLDIIETNDTAIKTTPFDGYVGLFGAINGATIKDLTVRGSVKGSNAAGIVARMDRGLIDNCKSYVNVVGASKVADEGKAGGIVCLTNAGDGDCTIRNCFNYGSVSTTTEDDNEGFVAGTKGGVAGIVGYVNKNTSITSCKNYGSIGSSYDKYGAGIAGYVTKGGNINISGCINEGTVSASLNAGGIVGISTDISSIINCENSGSISAGDNGHAGGIAGSTRFSNVNNCKNTATVYGMYSGGIVGVDGASTITNCTGGTADITSPSHTIGYTGNNYQLEVDANKSSGRLIGGLGGAGEHAFTKLSISANESDATLPAVGICGIYTTWSNLEITGGEFYGNPLAGNTSYIILTQAGSWESRAAGTYTRGGVNESSRIQEWTKKN